METGDTVKLMKTILVTGCSHSSGCERIDKLLFQGYNKFLQDAKHQTEYEVHNIVQKHKIISEPIRELRIQAAAPTIR